MKIVRGRLAPSELVPANTRYDATCDCIQVTTDGGSTWVEAIGQDPRHQIAYLKPPVGGSTQQCDAAANKVKWLKDYMDNIIAALTAGAAALYAANTLVQFLERLFPFAAYMIDLAFMTSVDIAGLGAMALNTAFDSTTYDALLCIFQCNSALDGSVSADDLSAIYAQIVLQLNTTAALIVSEILLTQGEVGLSNAGAIGSETGDCSACECAWVWEWDFTVDAQGWSVYSGYGAYTSGQGFQTVPVSTAYTLIMTYSEILTFTSQEWQLTVGYAHDPTGDGARIIQYGTVTGSTFTPAWSWTPIATPNPNTYDHIASEDWAATLYINPNGGDNTQTATVRTLRISGVGTIPAFSYGHQV